MRQGKALERATGRKHLLMQQRRMQVQQQDAQRRHLLMQQRRMQVQQQDAQRKHLLMQQRRVQVQQQDAQRRHLLMSAYRAKGQWHAPIGSFSNWSVRALILPILAGCFAMPSMGTG
ncbi:hypothetical protein [Pseudomonas coronafaciens]|uniref:hypothetical protein n=1 Tax=Pseudomonas coronafaciens TaxID=53409 RepID=UPI002E0E8B19